MTRGLSTDNVRSASRLKGFALLASGLVALVGLGVAHTGESPIGLEAAYAAQPLTGAPQIEGAGARATLAYWGSTDKVDPTRLHLSTVGQGVTIGLADADKVAEVSFFVDVPKSSQSVFSVDRRAPFTLPRRGRAGLQPYALGAHTLRADALLVNGRHRRLSVAYTVAHIVAMPASVDSAGLQQAIEKLPPGPVFVRPPLGATSFTVTGAVTMKRQDVTIDGARVDGGSTSSPGRTARRSSTAPARGSGSSARTTSSYAATCSTVRGSARTIPSGTGRPDRRPIASGSSATRSRTSTTTGARTSTPRRSSSATRRTGSSTATRSSTTAAPPTSSSATGASSARRTTLSPRRACRATSASAGTRSARFTARGTP